MSDENTPFFLDLFSVMAGEYKEDFNRATDPNILGCSELMFCSRKLAIKKIIKFGEIDTTARMLHGKILHGVVQSKGILPEILVPMSLNLNHRWRNLDVEVERHIREEISPGKFLDGHVDVYTNRFLVEIKTTSMLLEYYTKEVAPFHFAQINLYMGFTGVHDAYILSINTRGLDSKSPKLTDLSRKWTYCVPVTFDQFVFDSLVEKAKSLFDAIDAEVFEVFEGPEYGWECKYCPKEVKEICGRDEKPK